LPFDLCLQLGERESIIRLAGRTDLGRRQRGASSEGGCLEGERDASATGGEAGVPESLWG